MRSRISSQNGEGKRVGLWIRVSTEDQARGESPEHHEARGRMYAESKGWAVVTVYHLEGVSGKAVMNHPEAMRMLGDVRSGSISGLIFSKLARLARNTKELLDFAEYFETHGADLISLQESIDTSTPAGRLFYTLIAAMAQWEREEIAERVAASVPIRARLGKQISGTAPFGYAWVDGKLVPDEREAPVRRLMYELFREIRRVQTVGRLLNQKGHRTRGGGLFTNASVRRLLLDPTAKGVRRANFSRKGPKGQELKPESEWIEVPVPAIVDPALWEECAAMLRERRRGPKPGRRPVQLFAGFVYCACGPKMYVPSNTPKYVCNTCRNKIAKNDLETVFAEQLRGFVFSPDAIAQHLEAADADLSHKRDLLGSLEREQASVRDEAEKLYRLYLDSGLSVAEFRERNDPLAKRKEQLASEIPRLRGEIDFLAIRQVGSAEAIAQAQSLYAEWPRLPFEAKREIIETIVGRITVGKGEVEIDLIPADTHPFPPSPASPKLVATSDRTPRGRAAGRTAARSGSRGAERRPRGPVGEQPHAVLQLGRGAAALQQKKRPDRPLEAAEPAGRIAALVDQNETQARHVRARR